MADLQPMEMTYNEWLQTGVEEGYCSEPVRSTLVVLLSIGPDTPIRWDGHGEPVFAIRVYPPK